jgi:hypothetical protein
MNAARRGLSLSVVWTLRPRLRILRKPRPASNVPVSSAHSTALKLYFCPPIVAAYMRPPSANVNVCMPFT